MRCLPSVPSRRKARTFPPGSFPGKGFLSRALHPVPGGRPHSLQALLLPVLLLLPLLLVLGPSRACARPDPYNVAFLPMGLSLPDQTLRLDINVWYPTTRRNRRTFNLQSWTFRAASSNSPVAPGPFPLLLLSHHSDGSRFTQHDIALSLASEGFIVAAITHPLDNLDHMPQLYTWDLLAQRCRDISLLADILLEHELLGPAIDAGRMGLIGFGSGATTALILGGALPECTDWDAFCKDFNENHIESRSDERYPYCNAWARRRIVKDICPQLPLRKSLADTRIRAIAAIHPVFTMLLPQPSLRYFYPPLLLGMGSLAHRDGSRFLADLAARFSVRVEQLFLPGANLAAFMAECPDSLSEELPELCYSVDSQTRLDIHRQLVHSLAAFFHKNLVLAAPRSLPEPPVFELVGPPRPEEVQTRRGRRR